VVPFTCHVVISLRPGSTRNRAVLCNGQSGERKERGGGTSRETRLPGSSACRPAGNCGGRASGGIHPRFPSVGRGNRSSLSAEFRSVLTGPVAGLREMRTCRPFPARQDLTCSPSVAFGTSLGPFQMCVFLLPLSFPSILCYNALRFSL